MDIPYEKDGVNHEYFAGVDLKEGMDWIPMWVADMNFPTVPTVLEAIRERTTHPAFGYYVPRKEYYEEKSNCYHPNRNDGCRNACRMWKQR